ncbi:hypothetical protein M427DRAFT_136356 [Gonapodya prolifera JEL478]|uniref:Uncharacterized protein n=1 Tax=Gonapodya prolifera (strain JEL478) TaxID=1344416 RepID=A0A139ABE0_GONPJ|nr:hypothetical protein M427DRAFT_136356 [Gonapodya prolifera JEL478]|eukprot:KXS13785.1 hypothetical protein M427DRAFT_136356 [Gonapodya prolifera JEL478]
MSTPATPPQPPLAYPDPEPSSSLLELDPLDSFLALDTDGSSPQTQLHSVPISLLQHQFPSSMSLSHLSNKKAPHQHNHHIYSSLFCYATRPPTPLKSWHISTTPPQPTHRRTLSPSRHTPSTLINDPLIVFGCHRQSVSPVERAKLQLTFVADALKHQLPVTLLVGRDLPQSLVLGTPFPTVTTLPSQPFAHRTPFNNITPRRRFPFRATSPRRIALHLNHPQRYLPAPWAVLPRLSTPR